MFIFHCKSSLLKIHMKKISQISFLCIYQNTNGILVTGYYTDKGTPIMKKSRLLYKQRDKLKGK